jgi:hypothetical protein
LGQSFCPRFKKKKNSCSLQHQYLSHAWLYWLTLFQSGYLQVLCQVISLYMCIIFWFWFLPITLYWQDLCNILLQEQNVVSSSYIF